MIEVWKDIPSYEGLYQASNLGRIKSFARNSTRGGVLKQVDRGVGYYKVTLCKGGKTKQFNVHSIIAAVFLPNPNNYKYVDHIDENRKNNRIDNLQWCTAKQNLYFRDGVYRRAITRRGKDKRVISQYSLAGKKIKEFKTLHEAAKAVNGQAQNIWKVVKGKRLNAYGFNWRYES